MPYRTATKKIINNKTKRSSKIMVFRIFGGKTMENIKKRLKDRFSNQTKSVLTLTSFLKQPNPNLKEQFSKLLADATIIV